MDRKMIVQVIVLSVLVLILIGAVIWTVSRLRTPQGGGQTANSGRASAMPEGQIPSTRNQENRLAQQRMDQMTGDEILVNDNLFRVFQLSSASNPFQTESSWYAGALEGVKGYPELLDEEYFETMEPYFPDITSLFGEDAEFEKIELRRTEVPKQYSLNGSSADGRIKTTLTLVEPTAGTVDLVWTNEELALRKRADGQAIQFDEQGNPLPLPAGPLSPNGLLGDATGESLSCSGISLQGDTPSALLYLNNRPFLVREGTEIAPNYRVEQITQHGVLLIDRRDESSEWLPLSSPGADTDVSPSEAGFLPVGMPTR